MTQRNATLETIRNVGRQGWQRQSGYRRQAGVENLFFRYKHALGDSLRSWDHEIGFGDAAVEVAGDDGIHEAAPGVARAGAIESRRLESVGRGGEAHRAFRWAKAVPSRPRS